MRLKSINKRIVVLLSSLLCLLPWLTCCSKENVEAHQPARTVPVILAEVTTGQVESLLRQIGTLSAKDNVLIRSEASGVITEIHFTEGKDVRKGDILVRLESTKIQAQLENLRAKIRQLNVRLENKKKELERNKLLLKQNLVAAQQYENLQAEIEETEAEIAQSQADMNLQNERLSDTVIKAPISGVAGARQLSVGDYIQIGDDILNLVVLDPLDIQFRVPEKFIPKLTLGQTVQIMIDAYPEQIFPGTIFFIAPQVDITNRSVDVKAELENRERLLKPGMFARVLLITEVRDNAILIPTECLIQTEDETYIYTVDEQNVAHKIVVRLGESNKDMTEIISPVLIPGTRVILEGKYAARDGETVILKQTGAPA